MMTQLERKNPTPYIVIEATVGAGKSTLMELVSKEFGLVAYPEPVTNNPYLDKYYHDKERYAFHLQFYFAKERIHHTKSVIASGVPGILDRSVYGDYVFAKMLFDKGILSKHEFEIYTELMHEVLQAIAPPVLMIRLDLSVDEAIRRINKRGRSYEVIEKRSYWEDLRNNYEDFFSNYNHSPVLTIDVNNLDFESNPKDKAYVLDLIRGNLEQLSFPLPAAN